MRSLYRLINTRFLENFLEGMKASASPKCETHISGDSNPMTDLYGIKEHNRGSLPNHVVQSGVDVRISDHTFVPKDINVL